MMRYLVVGIVVICFFGALQPAKASVGFSTEVTSSSGFAAGEFIAGTPANIFFLLDTSIADNNPELNAGRYLNATVLLRFHFPDRVFDFHDGIVLTFNDTVNPDDQIFIGGDVPDTASLLNGESLQRSQLHLIGSTSMIADDNLPTVLPQNISGIVMTLQTPSGFTEVSFSPVAAEIQISTDSDGDGITDNDELDDGTNTLDPNDCSICTSTSILRLIPLIAQATGGEGGNSGGTDTESVTSGDILILDRGALNETGDLQRISAILKIDQGTGQLTVVARDELLATSANAFTYDTTRRQIYFTNQYETRVSRLEVDTGAQTLVSSDNLISAFAHGITVGLDGDLYVTTGRSSNVPGSSDRLIWVDSETGEQLSLSLPVGPDELATAASGRIYVAATPIEVRDGINFTTGGILEYDPATGVTREVSVGGLLDDPRGVPLDIAVALDGSVLATKENRIIRVDPQTGNQSIFYEDPRPFTNLKSIAVASDGTIWLLDTLGVRRIFSLDPVTLDVVNLPYQDTFLPRLGSPENLLVIP